ncbi:hypothetical protein [Paenibacillus pinistramenti]|uniref:hypothetical protein n=1 Tax=Paenibacillus pinistramenti TaxID=1768003 RepID=UPI00110925CD|nr:hypothetical protein [Paenibacillus pinistramenti]
MTINPGQTFVIVEKIDGGEEYADNPGTYEAAGNTPAVTGLVTLLTTHAPGLPEADYGLW